ncbi:MAG: recombinase family protein [Clostridia bacterium]|nr:recombinase family protein [Clostridia bacterium]
MKIAAYCRVSTGSDEQLSSLENQRAFFEEYAKKQGYDLVKIYADRGISGKALKNRTEFLNMLSDGKKKMFDMLVVKDISRFARNTLDFLTGIRTLKSCSIDVRFLSCNMTSLGESEFALTIFAAIAQEESYNLSKRIMFGKKVSAGKGRTPSVIYGYDKKDTYTLVQNPLEAQTVKEIFRLYTEENMGFRRIASWLNSKNIFTKNHKQWHAKTVSRIISNSIYCGMLINNKSETVDFLECSRRNLPKSENYIHRREELAIVSEETFEKAMKILKNNQQKADTNRSC